MPTYNYYRRQAAYRTMPANVGTIAGYRRLRFYQLPVSSILGGGHAVGMIISTFARPVWPLMIFKRFFKTERTWGSDHCGCNLCQNVPYQRPYAPQSNLIKIDQSDLFTIWNSQELCKVEGEEQANRIGFWERQQYQETAGDVGQVIEVWCQLSLETGTNLLNKWGQSYLSSW